MCVWRVFSTTCSLEASQLLSTFLRAARYILSKANKLGQLQTGEPILKHRKGLVDAPMQPPLVCRPFLSQNPITAVAAV